MWGSSEIVLGWTKTFLAMGKVKTAKIISEKSFLALDLWNLPCCKNKCRVSSISDCINFRTIVDEIFDHFSMIFFSKNGISISTSYDM